MTSVSEPTVSEPTLYVALELGAKNWMIAMTTGLGVRPWVSTVGAGNVKKVMEVLAQGRARGGLRATAPAVCCYEAGRDGFWIQRALAARGVRTIVVDSASIEVNRRARRAKTDHLDAVKLAVMLVRACTGERGVWREVRVPAAAVEAARHLSRERTQLVEEQTRMINQLRSWLATHGTRLPTRRRGAWWTTVRDWAGAALPAPVQARLARAQSRLALIEKHLDDIHHVQQAAVAAAAADSALGRLVRLKGIGTTSASVLLDEGLAWRAFRNRREVGGFLGFAPVPYQSGEQARDQGISRAGNARWRSTSIQLAWGWVRWQPSSALTRWYQQRFGTRGARARRIGIVALARQLMIALWRWATAGVVPTDASLKVA
jgi:transposase